MSKNLKCTLCSGSTSKFIIYRETEYLRCGNCGAVLLNPAYYLSPEREKERYLQHNNDVDDPGYQKFVEPVVSGIKNNFTLSHTGLDFGSGTGPVISKLLLECGYNIKMYDPFFCNEQDRLEEKYDYIACCEVIEHFQNPYKEFALLRMLLKKQGKLFCMTSLYDESINFLKWKYKDDATHVFFYHKKSIEWIQKQYNFSSVQISGKLIEFSV